MPSLILQLHLSWWASLDLLDSLDSLDSLPTCCYVFLNLNLSLILTSPRPKCLSIWSTTSSL